MLNRCGALGWVALQQLNLNLPCFCAFFLYATGFLVGGPYAPSVAEVHYVVILVVTSTTYLRTSLGGPADAYSAWRFTRALDVIFHALVVLFLALVVLFLAYSSAGF